MTALATTAAPELERQDFEYLRTFLLERSAMVLGEDKRYLVASRLGPVARRYGMESIAEMVHLIRQAQDSDVATSVMEALTINETLWFRDLKPFSALREDLIPEVIRRNQATRRLSVWSAAASTGQEIYSVAMLLRQDFPELDGWNCSLVGTDLSATVLEKARSGRFSTLEINRGLPVQMLTRFFTRDGAHYVIDESIRRMVSFSQLNLAGQWPVLLPKFDIIFLRNVLIYFDNNTKERIIALISKQLAPHGYLILGTAETVFSMSTGLIGHTVAGTKVWQKGPS
jgi:chemotaxis protein methyltransferase CheR